MKIARWKHVTGIMPRPLGKVPQIEHKNDTQEAEFPLTIACWADMIMKGVHEPDEMCTYLKRYAHVTRHSGPLTLEISKIILSIPNTFNTAPVSGNII